MADPYGSEKAFREANGLSPKKSSSGSSSGSSGSGSSSKSKSSGGSSGGGGSSGYAYKDKYGFTHVVSDYNTAKQYSGDGNVYSYSGSYGGGYAKDAKGNRYNLPISGATPFGNGSGVSGGGSYLGGLITAPTPATPKTAYSNYVYNASPSATNSLASQYPTAPTLPQKAAPTVPTISKTTPTLPTLPSVSNLLPLRDTFESRGYGVQYDNGNIHVYDKTNNNVLGTFNKDAYSLQGDKAYFDPSITKRLMELTSGSTPQLDKTFSMPTVSLPEIETKYPEVPVPYIDPQNLFQYQPFQQMQPNFTITSDGNETWTPTLNAVNQWYSRQDQLRSDYLSNWYQQQALAQQQAALDWEKEMYNSPYNKALQDMDLEYKRAQIEAQQALELQRIAAANRPSSSRSSSTTTKTPSASTQADAIIQSRMSSFMRPVDFAAQIQREVESGQISASVGSAVLDKLYKMYPTEEALMQNLSTWK
ncbi:hypothetical protein [Desulforamulus ruminis]|uniref:Uncharacterized protein n=1 Tax=Desulforamulus ruminis (strain ATCC 23193 / DSM 2154 / NCIMB 8452 / DL) TaxID=696281 RepID=F6DM35_DESRL|nr:hypothetical protein [Desulforamulus ruminis]AEG59377.1 hypothetical protein Desru_1102 [Desulforamulus ruminis DSM 2154]